MIKPRQLKLTICMETNLQHSKTFTLLFFLGTLIKFDSFSFNTILPKQYFLL